MSNISGICQKGQPSVWGYENEDKKRVVPTCQKRFNLYIPRGGLVPAAAASPFNRPHIII